MQTLSRPMASPLKVTYHQHVSGDTYAVVIDDTLAAIHFYGWRHED